MSISTASSSTPATTVNWTDLQSDIVGIIVHCFNDIIDFISFGATCRTWRSVTLAHLRLRCCRRQNSSQIPWLLLLRSAPPTRKSRRMKHRLTSTVPPLRFYNFSSKKSYFINHPPHLIPDIDNGKVKLIGSDNGYLIYNRSVHEEDYRYFVKFIFYDDFSRRSSENSILYFYNPVNGTNFSLPPAPVFDRSLVIVNKNPQSDNVIVAVVCYNGNADDPNSQKICIAVIRTGDTDWTRLNLSKVITDDFIEGIVFHQERLYAITHHLKMIVYEGISDLTFLSKEANCMESPAKQVFEETELGLDYTILGKLAESPDGKDLIFYATCMAHMGTNGLRMTVKLVKHDWRRDQWDLVECSMDHDWRRDQCDLVECSMDHYWRRDQMVKSSMDHDLSFFHSFDMLSVFWKSQSHLIANCTEGNDDFTGFDVSDGCQKRLNIPDNVEMAPYMWFIPNLS